MCPRARLDFKLKRSENLGCFAASRTAGGTKVIRRGRERPFAHVRYGVSVASGWQNKLARLSRKDWDEVQTRLGQEFHKRNDLLRHKLGIAPAKSRFLASLRMTEFGGKLFFTRGEAAKRAGLLRQYLPEQAAEIVRDADDICQHRFRLLGYDGLDYGAEIDWHLDRVHNKRAPLDPWFKISFLDFEVVGDHKVTWELNRHQHLVTLAKAWHLTNDDKYVRELMAQWRSWSKANPYPLGINWGSSLEVAFRSLSWIWVDHLLDGAPGYPEFHAELLPALAFHGRYIERFLSTYFSPNTHLLGEVVAMFFLGTLYPQMPYAARWKNEGWKVVLREAARQVRPDGVYFEQSLYYHVYALDFFLYARLLAAQDDLAIPAAYDDTMHRMLRVLEALAQAGPPEGFGDDDGGRVFNSRRNRTEHITDPLALGAVIYRSDDPGDRLVATRLTEESIWLFGEVAVTELARAEASQPSAVRSISFPDGGIYVLADSKPCAQVMAIDAGPHGAGRCGHGHADALSLRLTMNGEPWLVDSGSGVYISSDPAERNHYRGTAAHNTMRVDGQDQAVPDEPFSWKNIPAARAEKWTTAKTFSYFSGSHNGYERLADPVTHRRCVLRVNGDGGSGIWLVRDTAVGRAEHELELYWHLASGLLAQQAGASELIVLRSDDGSDQLRLIWPESSAWKTSISQGKISPGYGAYEPAPIVRCEVRAKLPAEIATALIGQTRAVEQRTPARMVSGEQPGVQVYELHDGRESHSFFFARDKRPWSSGLWSSDAELLYSRTESQQLMQLILIGGSSVAWQGQPLLKAGGLIDFFEWRKSDGVINAAPVPFSTTALFDELAGGARASLDSSNPTSSYAEKH